MNNLRAELGAIEGGAYSEAHRLTLAKLMSPRYANDAIDLFGRNYPALRLAGFTAGEFAATLPGITATERDMLVIGSMASVMALDSMMGAADMRAIIGDMGQ